MSQRKRPTQKTTNTLSPAMVTVPSKPSWKDHPIIIAATSAIAGFGFCILIVKEVLLPTQTAQLNNEIATLKNTINTLKGEIASLVAENRGLHGTKTVSEKEVRNLQAELDTAEKKITQAQIVNIFASGNPYPNGLDHIQIGHPISSVSESFPVSDIIRNEDGYWSVSTKHNIFHHVTYYYDDSKPSKPITHILFSMQANNLENEFLQNKLTAALGTPTKWKKNNQYSWATQYKATAYKESAFSYLLMRDGYKPALWKQSEQ